MSGLDEVTKFMKPKQNNQKKILMVEDETEFAEIVVSYLNRNGFAVDHADNQKDGLDLYKNKKYEAMVLDLGLPDGDGVEMCKLIRESSGIPIIVLTARDVVEDKVAAFNAGADDYMVKPMSLRELMVRIERLINRNVEDKTRSSVFNFDGVSFDTVNGELVSSRGKVLLTKKEKAVLEYLVLRRGRVLTRMEIMDHVWGEELDPFSNTVNMVVSAVRKKLKKVTGKNFIESVHGLGYKFEN